MNPPATTLSFTIRSPNGWPATTADDCLPSPARRPGSPRRRSWSAPGFSTRRYAGRTPTAQSQVVILAAGMDARSYRLPWRDGATVFEVDQPQVIAIKDERLPGAAALPTCGGRRRSRRRLAENASIAGIQLLGTDGLDDRGVVAVHRSVRCRPAVRAASMRYRRPTRCCCTTSSARRCSKRRSCRTPRVHAKARRTMGFRLATHRPPWSRAEAGPRRSPIWL